MTDPVLGRTVGLINQSEQSKENINLDQFRGNSWSREENILLKGHPEDDGAHLRKHDMLHFSTGMLHLELRLALSLQECTGLVKACQSSKGLESF